MPESDRWWRVAFRVMLILTIIGMVAGCRPAHNPSIPMDSPAPTARPPSMPALPTVAPSPSPSNVPDAAKYAAQLRQTHPEAIWPHWFSDKKLAWTAVGLDAGGTEALIATDGTFSPITNTIGINIWLRDDTTGQLYTPAPPAVKQSLDDGSLPIVTSQWSAGPAFVQTTLFASSTGQDPIRPTAGANNVLLGQVAIHASGPSHTWTLYVATRPYGPAGGVSTIDNVSANASSISANGALVAVSETPATSFRALNETAVDASVLAKNGNTKDVATATSAHGLAEGLLGYRFQLGGNGDKSFSFAFPMQHIAPSADAITSLSRVNVAAQRTRVASAWHQELHHVEFSVGDQRIVDGFYASLAYILMSRQGNLLFSGPMSEHALWVRDGAYLTQALDQTGHTALVGPVLREILSTQLPTGRFPPIIGLDGKAREPMKTEWDSQGEAIFALVEYARQTHDLTFLREVYPNIRQAAVFQREQLRATRIPSLRGTPYYGILPAGESAEDLYSAKWHHYWDDFWAMAGFQEAATAARMLGKTEDATWMTDEENQLRNAVLAGVDQVKTSDGLPFIPNGPEDTHSTAMARSATPAIWPVEVMDPHSALIQHSFEAYYQWTVKPYGGAYDHYGNNYWPYAGLSLAHAFYRLGMMDHTWVMLQWVLEHQTAPGLYAWAEAVSPKTFTFVSGDMPHTWMSAEFIMLVRDMLVQANGNTLQIGPFPAAWLPPGGRVVVKGFPTTLGNESYTLERSPDGLHLKLILAGTPPPGGYVFTVPSPLTPTALSIDGSQSRTVTGATFTLPSGTHQADITLAKPA